MGGRHCAVGAGLGARLQRKFRLALATAATLIAAAAAGAEAGPPVRALDHHATLINGAIVGSAFLIAADLALTNAHVVEGLGPGAALDLVPPGGAVRVRVRVIAVSPRMDLALLRVPEGVAPPVGPLDAARRIGLAVRGAGVDASGGRGAAPPSELAGALIDPNSDLGAFGPGMVLRMPGVRPGFSGGPVLDGEGRLVGMITAIRSSDALRPGASGDPATARRGPADQAFVLRAREIRDEARRLLLGAAGG